MNCNHISRAEAVKAIEEINNLLYREASPAGYEFLNLDKEVDGGDFVEEVSSILARLIKPPASAPVCDECWACIPSTPGGHLENKWHDVSCSLHDSAKE